MVELGDVGDDGELVGDVAVHHVLDILSWKPKSWHHSEEIFECFSPLDQEGLECRDCLQQPILPVLSKHQIQKSI